MGKSSKQKTNPKKEMDEEMKEFVKASILYLKSMGTFAKKVGEIEKRYPEAFKIMEKLSSPDTLTEFVTKAPPEIVVSMLKIFIRAGSLSSKMGKRMDTLTPDEKIDLGKELVALANDLSDLMEKLKEKE